MSQTPCLLPVRIRVVDPDGQHRFAEFAKGDVGPINVGRAPENDIQLISPYISRRHAEVWPHPDGILFVDLSSTSGSYVDGSRVDKTILRIGETTFLGSPDGLKLSIHSTEEDLDEVHDDRQQTEVLKVANLESSAYLTSTGRLFARPGQHPAKAQEAANRKVEQRLFALIGLTTDLLEVNDPGAMATKLLHKVFELLSIERGMILLGDEGELTPFAWKVRQTGDIVLANIDAGPKTLETGLVPSDRVKANVPFNAIRTVTNRVFSEGVGLLSLDASSDQRLQGSHSVLLQSVRSILCAPIASAKEVYGVIYVDTHETLNESDEDDLDWLVAAAHQAGMVMEKLNALSQKQRMTDSLVRALAASIDARDGLTAGHSARVAHYSVGIARTLKLDVAAQYSIYYAALLHDYGKIGIDDAVLKKPARLTPEEFDHIKLHPKFTFDILSKIDFPPELSDLPMMAASHHERWDGSGYPWGLKGDATPLAGRIIAIADVYDSLTRKRHYRDPMPLDEVLAYLEEGRASHFDPRCLDAFFAYHREELNAKERRRVEKRQQKLTDEPTGGLDDPTRGGSKVSNDGDLAETDPAAERTAARDSSQASFFDSTEEGDGITVRVEGSS